MLQGAVDDAPREIGNYRLLSKVGEGGMGEVYEAEQLRPVQRRVALKLIKRGMDTREVIARFEAERQALALMEHPNIARVLDAGATKNGRPFFVMELVPGVPITEYCDRERLSTDERLNLFVRVCDAVQHAHHKGVIHRDLKPSNVLVSMSDGKPTPKVIDFGVAKATAQRLTEHTVYTELGQQIGTPEYMSPEQAERSELDVDTRTDVYSLGVLLYELLVGRLPFESKELREAGWDAMRQMIRETDPPRPSTRASKLDAKIARSRRTDPGSLARRLRGDLDWIVMRTLEKDRTRRYGTPSELAAEIDRFRKGEPVLAGPPGLSYRLGKAMRRHRVGVLAGTLVLLALVSGAIAATVGMVRAQRAEQRAVAAEARARAEAEAKGQVSDFLKELFRVSRPSEARGNSITAREVLDSGAARIDTMLVDQPETRGELMFTMSEVYAHLGLFDQASPLIEQALETFEHSLGQEHLKTLDARAQLAATRFGQGELAEAERLFTETLETQRRVLGDDHRHTLSTMDRLGFVYRQQQRFEEAEPLYLESYEGLKRLLPPGDQALLRLMNSLAVLYDDVGRPDEAEPLYLESLEAQRQRHGDDHPETIDYLNNLARFYFRQGRVNDAVPMFEDALAARRKVQGDEHPATMRSISNLAYIYQSLQRWDEAEPLYTEALESMTRVHGPTHPNVQTVLYNMACYESLRGEPQQAIERLKQSVDAGWARPELMKQDSDLEPIRSHPRFASLVAQSERTLARLERARPQSASTESR
ncbi:hypothetical protein ABI59_21680 [Acidobacteria bacterium Mor1]|nr:hypothetical protein ABI59_21680 [Acidobacteria bacterium Mor1]